MNQEQHQGPSEGIAQQPLSGIVDVDVAVDDDLPYCIMLQVALSSAVRVRRGIRMGRCKAMPCTRTAILFCVRCFQLGW